MCNQSLPRMLKGYVRRSCSLQCMLQSSDIPRFSSSSRPSRITAFSFVEYFESNFHGFAHQLYGWFAGALPSQLGDLTALVELNLARNSLCGNVVCIYFCSTVHGISCVSICSRPRLNASNARSLTFEVLVFRKRTASCSSDAINRILAGCLGMRDTHSRKPHGSFVPAQTRLGAHT